MGLFCLRADVSYFLCSACNKGNRRRLHAGKGLLSLVLFTLAPSAENLFKMSVP